MEDGPELCDENDDDDAPDNQPTKKSKDITKKGNAGKRKRGEDEDDGDYDGSRSVLSGGKRGRVPREPSGYKTSQGADFD